MTQIALSTVESTEKLGAALAAHLPKQPVILYLEGDLGAGKTTTARSLLHALGVTGAVRSPTYTLIESYDTASGGVAHMDLYRIADPEELEYLALDELAAEARLWLVEWPMRGKGVLPKPDLILWLKVEGVGRMATFEPHSESGKTWAEAVTAEFAVNL